MTRFCNLMPLVMSSRFQRARRVQVAPYPFTTLQPHLGSLQYEAELSLTIADIPGLIPGAAYNRGLGHSFLRHISRAKALIFVLDISSGLAENKEGPRPWEQLALLQVRLRTPQPVEFTTQGLCLHFITNSCILVCLVHVCDFCAPAGRVEALQ